MKTVLCFGDSNTHGTCPMVDRQDRRRFAKADRWPNVMAATLGESFDVIAEGHPGRTTVHPDPIEGVHKNGLAALPVILESHRPIDLVILLLGTNDLKARYNLPASDIALSVERLVDAVKASDSGPDKTAPAMLLVAPPPIEETGVFAEMFAGGAAKSRQLGALYGDIATGKGIAFFDAGTAIESDANEGIHWAVESHAALGRAIAQQVSNMMK